MREAFAVAKTNFKNSKLAFWITIGCVLSVILSTFTNEILQPADSGQVSFGMYFYLYLILTAIFFPSLNFRKLMNLGARKSSYIGGCAINYIVSALVISLVASLVFHFADPLFRYTEIWNLLSVFRWAENGMLIAFFQQSAFLILVAALLHTLTTVQTFWYGWLIDILLIAYISVFTSVPVLRPSWGFLFRLFLWNPSPLLQIILSLFFAVLIYLLSIPAVKQKKL